MVSLLIFSSKQCIIKQLLDLVVGSIPILNSEFFLCVCVCVGGGGGGGGASSLHTYFIYYGGGFFSPHIFYLLLKPK